MNFTKLFLLAVMYSAGLLTPSMAVADTDPATFQAEKERHIAKILERIQIDQKNLSCLQAAQEHAALKVCDETAKQDHDVSEPKEEPKQEAPVADKKTQKDTKNKGKK
ncbi:MAG: hypothetical protein Q8L15_07660 [Methylobacter sp.]|nr:hypothetical protein [Methylobacter sp.]